MLGKSFLLGLALFATSTIATAQKTATAATATKAQTTKTTTIAKPTTATKSEARAFGLEIVKAHINRDCNFIWSKFNMQMRVIESGTTMNLTEAMKAEFCNDNPLRTDIEVTYDKYINNYNVEVYTAADLAQSNPEWAAALNLKENEFLFLGSQRKSEASEYLFRASDAARFVLAYNNGQFKIVAL